MYYRHMKISKKIVLLLFLICSLFPFYNAQAQIVPKFPTLRQGNKGPEVWVIQQKLQKMGYIPAHIKINGYFGPATKKGVIDFQKEHNLPPIGVVGPLTRAELFRDDIVVAPSSSITSAFDFQGTTLPNNQNITTQNEIVVVPPNIATIPTPTVTPVPPPPPPQVVVPPPNIIPEPEPPPIITTTAKTALPLYIYPTIFETNWDMAINAGSNKVDFIIANVYNGPGTAVESSWTSMIQNVVQSGIKVYGYVSTNYGLRSATLVDQDIKKWIDFYPHITGIFLDETASDTSKLAYYTARYNYIKSLNQGLTVVINPGTNTDEGYMAASDVNVLFESSYSSWQSKQMPLWVFNYPKERFYAIVYDVPTETIMKDVVKQAKQRNFGKIFITNASTPSDPLPPYFLSELDEIRL